MVSSNTSPRFTNTMPQPNPRILIATPCKYTVTAHCALSLVNMVKSFPYELQYAIQMGVDVAGSRITLVKKARELGFTHILFVDDDQSFDSSVENPLLKLLKEDRDIIGADYNYRELPLRSVTTPLTERSNGLFKCKGLGTGFMLIRLSVFDKLEQPWFAFDKDEEGRLLYTDDEYFCKKAIEAGFDVWCDPSVKVGHVGMYVY